MPLPQVYQDIGAPSPDHFIFDKAPHIATQIQSLQQSLETYDPADDLYYRLDGRNEVTADAVLNWFYHQSTGGVYGFTPDQAGLNWQQFMDQNMDVAIRNAVVYNAFDDLNVKRFFAEEEMLPPVIGIGTIEPEIGAVVRSIPSDKGKIIANLQKGTKVILHGRTQDDDDDRVHLWNAVGINGVNWVRYDLVDETWSTNDRSITKQEASFDFDLDSPYEIAEQWFLRLAAMLG